VWKSLIGQLEHQMGQSLVKWSKKRG